MVTFKVEKMSCGGCAARITRAVHALDPEAQDIRRVGSRKCNAGIAIDKE